MGALEHPGLDPSTLREKRWRSYFQGIQARDPQALALLYDETSRVLYSMAYRMLNNPGDAEEVVLDAYQQIWNSGHTYDPARGTVWGWLVTVTRNRAIDRLRNANLRRSRELPIEEHVEAASEAAEPEQETLFHEEQALVRKALGMLDPSQREAIELAFYSGLSHSEVAETLGAPLGTVKTRIRVGIMKLRKTLEPTLARRN